MALATLLGVQSAVYMAWFYWQVGEEEQNSLQVAAALTETCDVSLRDVLHDADQLGRGVARLMPYSEEESKKFLHNSAAASSPAISWSFVNPQGRIIASTNPPSLAEGVAGQPYFRQLLAGRPWEIVSLGQENAGLEPAFVIAARIETDCAFRGAMIAVVDGHQFVRSIFRLHPTAGGIFSICDRVGTLIYRDPPEGDLYTNRRNKDEFLDAVLDKGQPVVGICRSAADGQEEIAARYPMASTGWVVGVDRSLRSVTGNIVAWLWGALAANLVVASASLAAVLHFGRRLTRPIWLLRLHASAIGRGDFQHRTQPAAIQELAELVDAFNRMAGDLKQAQEEQRHANAVLEERVRERTAELQELASRLRALMVELGQAEDRERRRLAHVLHDHLQQLLVSARMRLSSLQRKLADPVHSEQLKEIDYALEESIRESRSLAVELSPPVLYDRGLVAALGWLAERTQRQHGLQVAIRAAEGVDPLAEPVSVLLFQAARELLFNVVKHAAASQAIFDIRRTEAYEICMVVADDGVGFDVGRQATRAEASFGLFSIRQRLEWFGGRLEIDSGVGKGTRVTLRVPIRATRRPSAEALESASSSSPPPPENRITRTVDK